MSARTMEMRAHTTSEGTLQLDLNVGVPDADVTITVRLIPSATKNVDANCWPLDFFEKVAGSMPALERAPQGDVEKRMPLA